jgi:Tfp pilus assembly protein PilP
MVAASRQQRKKNRSEHSIMHWVTGVAVLIGIGASLQLTPISSAQERRVLPSVPRPGPGVVPPGLSLAQHSGSAENNYKYERQGRRDPFDALVKEKPASPAPPEHPPGPVIDPARPRDPLERFDLSAMKLMGIVWGELGRRAVIRAPDGKGYFVTVGMYMGQNGGRIVAIEEEQLVIEEKHRDQEGKIVSKTLTIPLRRKENQQG